MVRILLFDLEPITDVLAGAALGEKHAAQIWSKVSDRSAGNDMVVLLDFRGISAVTPSYLKKTLPALYNSGEQDTSTAALFPLYTNLSLSTEDDVHHFLLAHRLPGIAVRSKGNALTFQKRIGWLEAAATETLSRLGSINSGSAADLMTAGGGSSIALTAWNNRLAELFRLRLATRTKTGRYWIYRPIVEVKNNG